MQDSQTPAKFPAIWAHTASSPYINTIPTASQQGIKNGAASFADGFPPNCFIPYASGGAGPFGGDTNGILQQITAGVQWLQAGGPLQYDAVFSSDIGGYPKGALLHAASGNGQYWLSTADNNTTDPDTGGAGWLLLSSLAFPTGLGTITANTTLTGASAGNYYNVGGSAETFISLDAATFTAGQTIGFLAQQVAGISTTSGSFYGGSLSGSSFTMPIGSFVALQWDGINWKQLAGAFSRGRLIGIQIFAASGTYTPTNGMSNVIFEVQGGGSAGTGATGATGSNVSMGSPGMAGAYAKGIFTAAMIGASQPVIVGAGGTGVTGSTGNSGGTSSVGALITAPGGIAVSTLTNQVPPSANGNGLYSSAPTGANIVSILGSASTVSLGLSTTLGLGGAGGRSQFGDGGPGVSINAVGSNAVNPGSGGSGVVVNASGGTIPGGNGAPGIVIAWEYS